MTQRYVVLRAARPQAPKSLSVSAPTGSGSYVAGASLTVAWSTNRVTSSGEFGLWARSPAGSWYVGKLLRPSGASSYSTSLPLDVPVGSGYQAIVAWRATAGSGSWSLFGTSPGASRSSPRHRLRTPHRRRPRTPTVTPTPHRRDPTPTRR